MSIKKEIILDTPFQAPRPMLVIMTKTLKILVISIVSRNLDFGGTREA